MTQHKLSGRYYSIGKSVFWDGGRLSDSQCRKLLADYSVEGNLAYDEGRTDAFDQIAVLSAHLRRAVENAENYKAFCPDQSRAPTCADLAVGRVA